jgi:3-isopropylmalate/(R)-2-methylmalate dehydratase large subunit
LHYISSQNYPPGATGYFVEQESFEDMTMEGRTVCNLSIEMGARRNDCPRSNDFDYLEGRLYAPKGAAWDTAVAYWKTLKTDADAKFDEEINFDASDIEPMITYGTNPGMGLGISKVFQTLKMLLKEKKLMLNL